MRTFWPVVLSAGCLLAQQPSAPAASNAPLILKATTRLVMLSVIARDKNNQPAADLTKDDFRVKVNGKVQPITVFSMESADLLPQSQVASLPRPGFGPSLTSQGTLPPGVFSNRLTAQSGTPSGVTVILVDTRNTKATDQIYAKAQVIR
jgi:VWFA-related protein